MSKTVYVLIPQGSADMNVLGVFNKYEKAIDNVFMEQLDILQLSMSQSDKPLRVVLTSVYHLDVIDAGNNVVAQYYISTQRVVS
jgi:translation elongation factor EF-1alpha